MIESSFAFVSFWLTGRTLNIEHWYGENHHHLENNYNHHHHPYSSSSPNNNIDVVPIDAPRLTAGLSHLAPHRLRQRASTARAENISYECCLVYGDFGDQ